MVILGLYEGLPSTEHISIQVEAGHLRVGNYTFACRWEERKDLPISLPLKASVSLVLSLRLRYTEAEISRAGLIAELVHAEQVGDRAIATAATALKRLEITKADLMEYYAERLQRQHVGNSREEPKEE